MSEEIAQARHSCVAIPGRRTWHGQVAWPGVITTRLCRGPGRCRHTRTSTMGRDRAASTTAVPRSPREPLRAEEGAWQAGSQASGSAQAPGPGAQGALQTSPRAHCPPAAEDASASPETLHAPQERARGSARCPQRPCLLVLRRALCRAGSGAASALVHPAQGAV